MTALLFDLDGTLIDSAPDIHAAVTRTLAEEGAPALPFDQVRGFIGNGVPVLIGRVMAARGEVADPNRQADLVSRFLRHYMAASAVLTTVYPGVQVALLALQAKGHKFGICTNKPEAAARAILKAFGMGGMFQLVIGGDSLPERKPDPAPLLAARLRLGERSALFVGDSEVDAEAAAAAGMPFLLFTQGYRHKPLQDLPHRVAFAEYSALPGIVATLTD